MDGIGDDFAFNENISGTLSPGGGIVTGDDGGVPCGYVVAESGPARFCDAPAARGSSYCAPHRALCQVAPGSPEAAAILASLAREADRPAPTGIVNDQMPEPLNVTEPDEVVMSRGRGADADEGA